MAGLLSAVHGVWSPPSNRSLNMGGPPPWVGTWPFFRPLHMGVRGGGGGLILFLSLTGVFFFCRVKTMRISNDYRHGLGAPGGAQIADGISQRARAKFTARAGFRGPDNRVSRDDDTPGKKIERLLLFFFVCVRRE